MYTEMNLKILLRGFVTNTATFKIWLFSLFKLCYNSEIFERIIYCEI